MLAHLERLELRQRLLLCLTCQKRVISFLEETGDALMSVQGVAESYLDASAKISASSCVEMPRLVTSFPTTDG